MNKKIIFGDPIPMKHGHSVNFNINLYNNFKQHYNNFKLLFATSLDSEIIKNKITSEFILKEYNYSYSLLKRTLILIYNYYKILNQKNNNDEIILTNFEIKTLSIFLFFSKKKINLIIHNPKLIVESKINLILFKQILRKCKHAYVLSKFSYKYINQYCKSEKISVLEHPIKNVTNETTKNKKYDYTFIGTIEDYKGVETLMSFIKKIKEIPFNNRPKLNIIGLNNTINTEKKFIGEKINRINKYLSNHEYEYYISNSKYVMLFHKINFYPIVSGLYYDAISFNTSVLFSDNYMWLSLLKQNPCIGNIFNEKYKFNYKQYGSEKCFKKIKNNIFLNHKNQIKKLIN